MMTDVNANQHEDRRPWVWAGVFLAALVLRIIHLIAIRDFVCFDTLIGDAAGYDAWAKQLVRQGFAWDETFYQAPLYPYFLASVYALFGDGPWAVRVVQCVLGSVACVLVGLAAGRLLCNRAGLAAGLLLALYAPAIYFDGIIQKASVAFFLVSVLLYAVSRAVDGSSALRWGLVGGVIGLLALTRENALVFAPAVLGWLILRPVSIDEAGGTVWCSQAVGTGDSHGLPATPADRATHRMMRGDAPVWRRRVWPASVAVVVGLMLALAPAMLHNSRCGGGLALTTFQSGPNFWMGNHARADGRYTPLIPGRETPEFERADATALAERATGKRLSPREVSDYWMGLALDDIRSAPVRWVGLMWKKWHLTWNRYEIPDTESYELYRGESPGLAMLGFVMHFGVLVPLACAGGVVLWDVRRRLTLIYLLAVSFAGAVAIFYVFGRYRFPLVPIVAIPAAGGLTWGMGLFRDQNWNKLAACGAVGLVAAVWCNWPVNPERELNAGQLGNLGATLASQGRLEEAVVYFDRAVRMYPDAPRLRQFLADGLSLTGRFGAAIPHYEAVVRIEPGRPNAHFNLAVALERIGRLADALGHYESAARANPSDVAAVEAVRRVKNALVRE